MVDPEKQGEFHLIILVCHFCRANFKDLKREKTTNEQRIFLETNYGIHSQFPLKFIVLLNYGLRCVKKIDEIIVTILCLLRLIYVDGLWSELIYGPSPVPATETGILTLRAGVWSETSVR